MLGHVLSKLFMGFSGGLATSNRVLQTIDLQTIGVSFNPRISPHCPAFHAILKRNEEPFPVIIEIADVAYARQVLEGDMFEELERFLSSTPPFEGIPWISIIRDLKGNPEGMALSWLTGRGPATKMRCDRDRKRTLSGEGKIHSVGLALLMTKLHWMKSQGYWPSRGNVLTHYQPQVIDSYRRQCGLQAGFFSGFEITTESVTSAEGNLFLRNSPIPMRAIRI